MITIKKVGHEAIPVIRELAMLTWPVTYGDILPEGQIDYMLNLYYSEDALKRQMEKENQQFIVATEKKQPVGFASYSPISEDDLVTCELHKLYIDPTLHGKGIGQLLLGHIINDVEAKG